MRKVTWSAAVSLDLYLAAPDEALDWLQWSDDATSIVAESWKGVDTLLMGRKTYEFAASSGGGGGGAGASGIRTYIFSRTMTEAPAGAALVTSDPAAFVGKLKQEDGGDIIVLGGGELASALIEGGVVDEIGLNVHPLLLGGGIPFFRPMARRVALALVEARPIAKDCVFLRYRLA
ncbi:MAG TPA: dihydrofolate reductase family protein [Allosphingosinicella sp.]|nr:dihydrofolate reductase family protein [Allosphingosinicella sp.]